jgi:hypothetical protein
MTSHDASAGRPHANAKRYLAVFAATVLIAAAAVAGFLCNLSRQGRLPPLPISGNICLDEKIEWLRQRGDLRCDVLAAGSSMTLNNLASERLRAALPPTTSYLNVGAWGLKIGDTSDVIGYALEKCRPRLVVLVCGPMDFYRGPPLNVVKKNEYDTVISGAWYPLLVARHLDLAYYLRRSGNLAELRTSRGDYDSLLFDDCGGITLEIDRAHINPQRWDEHVRAELFDERHYRALDDLAARLEHAGIALICAQAPLRADALGEAVALEAHWRRLGDIMALHGFRFINCHGRLDIANDEFADYSHLNRDGACAFTDEFMRESVDDVARALSPGRGLEPVDVDEAQLVVDRSAGVGQRQASIADRDDYGPVDPGR